MMLKPQGDLGNISKVNEPCNFIATYDNHLEKQTLFHHQIAIISDYGNIRLRCITRYSSFNDQK